MSNKIQPIRLKWRKKSSKILQSYLVSPVPAESLKKMKSEENEKIEIHIYVKILARTGERSYFYQIFMRRKQAIPLQGSELFYKAEKKYHQRLFELPRYVVGHLFQRRGINLDNHQNQPGISNFNNYMANNH